VVALATALPSQASDFNFSGTTELASKFCDYDLRCYTSGPTVRTIFNIEHSSGWYGEAWTNVGLTDGRGDEIDLTVGYGHELSDGLNLDVYTSLFIFRDGYRQLAFSGALEYHGFQFRGEYYIPIEGDVHGVRLTASYTKEWEKFSLAPSVVYDTGPYEDTPAITVAGLNAEYRLTEKLSVTVFGQLPIIKEDYDTRNAKVMASIKFRF
jgi:hypothetical protein